MPIAVKVLLRPKTRATGADTFGVVTANPATTMTKALLFTAAAMLTTSAFAQPNAKPVGGNGPMIEVDQMVYDYGTIQKGANGRGVFVVTNTGDAPLLLTNCQGSCGCTVPTCDTAPIKPGGKSEIVVQYDTQRVGPINKTVTINSNATNIRTLQVMIKGTVEDPTGAAPEQQRGANVPAEKR